MTEQGFCVMASMIYHVFLSFRGEDTRKTFTDHLYTALLGAGFRTFRDDDGIERGKNVKSELDKAIKEARSSIVVFSKNYASSGWCLDELMMILKRKRTSSGAGHAVLPVFYDVDPYQVRKQTGSFGEAFCRHEERLNVETNERKKEYLREKVQAWRRALREVADLAGMVLQNQAEGVSRASLRALWTISYSPSHSHERGGEVASRVARKENRT